jgi:DNA (cytosine-5)-methyltransferase 3A
MNIISLFDGISAGQLALERAGIKVDKYYASEIDKNAIFITQKNYPNTIQLGDVKNWETWDIEWGKISMIIGGSPCTSLSFSGNKLGFDGASGLIKYYFEVVKHIQKYNPKVVFLLENVVMKKEWEKVISEELKVEPLLINSSLVSCQNRPRLYWINFPNIKQPLDKKIALRDILEDSVDNKYIIPNKRVRDRLLLIEFASLSAKQRQNILKGGEIPSNIEIKAKPGMFIYTNHLAQNGSLIKEKCATLCCAAQPHTITKDLQVRRLTPIEVERAQTFPDKYTEGLSDSARYKVLGNSWTVDVISHIFKEIK